MMRKKQGIFNLVILILLILTGCEIEKDTHFVGEIFGGGIIFWVSPDGQHGLIASLTDLDEGNGIAWNDGSSIGESAESMTDGAKNTNAIVTKSGSASGAAKLCSDYEVDGFDDWYLPAQRQFCLLAAQDILIDYILDNDSDPNTNGFTQEYSEPTLGYYWTSTERRSVIAWGYSFPGYHVAAMEKNCTFRVRAVRSF